MKAKLLIIGVLATVLIGSARTAYATDQVVTDPGDNGGANQLRAKITAAQSSGGGTITFTTGTATIVLGGILPTITANITIDGGNVVTISGANTYSIFSVNSGATLTLNNLTISNALNPSGDGGAIVSHGALNINNSKFLNNQAASGFSGGAIESYGPLNITNSEFAFNKAGNGGALFPRESTTIATITGSNFHDNQTTNTTNGWGGVMLVWNGAQMNIDSTNFTSNTARQGGAIYVTSVSVMTITNSTMTSNQATIANGGGIANNGTTTLYTSTLNGNTAPDGGGIFNSGGATLILNYSSLSNNMASQFGGGISNSGTATLNNSILSGNTVTQTGGAIYNVGTATLNNTVLRGNSASIGGGLTANIGMTTLNNSTLTGNIASNAGGGIYSFGNVNLNTSTLNGNSAGNGGGGFYNDHSIAVVTNSTLSGNSTPTLGGGFFNSGNATFYNATLANNSAASGGELYIQGSVSTVLTNTILAYSPSGGNCGGSSIASSKFTFSSDFTCGLPAGNTIKGNNPNGLDPLLDPLSNYGGPTQVHLPKANSPAVDGIVGSDAPPIDQRGIPRPQFNGYDIGAVEFAPSDIPRLANISTRGEVGTGDDVMIGGFVITGTANKTVLLRAIGASLSNPPINLTGTLQDPTLSLFNSSQQQIGFNDNWAQAANASSIPVNLQPSNALESAILTSLAPGAYTAIVSGLNGGTGLGLVEVFDLDATVPSKLYNISTRGLVETGDNVLIGGFIVKGPDNEMVVVRAIGPSLANFGLGNVLQNPNLGLFNDQGMRIQFNDDWQTDQANDIMATGLQPSNPAESAILRILMPGNYTAIVQGVDGTTGLALVEIFGLN
jgi:predicted outer membrane repeat protein